MEEVVNPQVEVAVRFALRNFVRVMWEAQVDAAGVDGQHLATIGSAWQTPWERGGYTKRCSEFRNNVIGEPEAKG